MMGGMGLLMVLFGLVFLAVPVALIAGLVSLLMVRGSGQNTSTQSLAQPVRSVTSAPIRGGRICPNCGQVPAADWNHCAHCGASLAAS